MQLGLECVQVGRHGRNILFHWACQAAQQRQCNKSAQAGRTRSASGSQVMQPAIDNVLAAVPGHVRRLVEGAHPAHAAPQGRQGHAVGWGGPRAGGVVAGHAATEPCAGHEGRPAAGQQQAQYRGYRGSWAHTRKTGYMGLHGGRHDPASIRRVQRADAPGSVCTKRRQQYSI